MAVGQTYDVPSGTGTQYFVPSGFTTNTIGILNPNDGVAYISRNRPPTPPTTTGAWDWKIPSQSYAMVPGPFMSVGVWYTDQSGTNVDGQITVYPIVAATQYPLFQAIGRAVQAIGSSLDITQGTQPANPGAGNVRLWADGSGNLHILQPTGVDHTVLDSSNYLPYVANGVLGGDLYGTVSAGHVRLANNSTIQAFDAGGTARNLLWLDGSNYVDLANAGGQLTRILNQANSVDLWHIDNSGNVTQAASLYLGTNQWLFLGSGATNGIISDNTNLYLRTNGAAYIQNTGGTWTTLNTGPINIIGNLVWNNSGQGFSNPGNSYINLNAPLAFDNAANSPGARLAFNQNVGNKITFYDTGGGNSYGMGVQSNYLEFYTGGTGFNWKSNATGGAQQMSLTSGNLSVSGNFNGTTGVSSSSGAGDFAQWVRSQSGTMYLTTTGDRMVDGGDNNNWVFYGPMGSVNFVFQHRDGSWMGEQAANFQTMSDLRLKTDILPVTDADCLRRLRTPSVPIITWQAQDNPSRDIGFTAQDMLTAVPEVVYPAQDGEPGSISYGNLTAVLWGALRNVDERVAALEAHVHATTPGPPGSMTGLPVYPTVEAAPA